MTDSFVRRPAAHTRVGFVAIGILVFIGISIAPPRILADGHKAERPILVVPEDTYPITFSKLLVRPSDTYDISLAGAEFNVMILEALRRLGYNAVGAENLLFDVHESHKARMVLGGNLTDLTCRREPPLEGKTCSLSVTWELFDVLKKKVIYKVATRSHGRIRKGKKLNTDHVHKLVLRALDSLLSRYKFVDILTKTDEPPSLGHESAEYKRCAAEPRALPEAMDEVLETVVVVKHGDTAVGAGVFFSPDGLVLTADHVVEGELAVTIETKSGIQLEGRVLRRDPLQDIAVLRVDGRGFSCLPLSDSLVSEGVAVYAIGNPFDEQLSFSVSKGVVSGLRTIDDQQFIQTDAGINPGNSGGPLVSTSGHVVGIVVFKRMLAEGIAFAAPMPSSMHRMKMTPSDETSIETAHRDAPRESKVVIDMPDSVRDERSFVSKQYKKELRVIKRRRGGGGIGIFFGTILTLSGSFVLIWGGVRDDNGLLAAGGVTMGVGVGALIGGGVMVAWANKEKRRLEAKYKITRTMMPTLTLRGPALDLTWRF